MPQKLWRYNGKSNFSNVCQLPRKKKKQKTKYIWKQKSEESINISLRNCVDPLKAIAIVLTYTQARLFNFLKVQNKLMTISI